MYLNMSSIKVLNDVVEARFYVARHLSTSNLVVDKCLNSDDAMTSWKDYSMIQQCSCPFAQQ